MAGPLEQETVRFKIPPGEAQRVYAPGLLAFKVENFVVSEEESLRAVRGPVEYEHKPSTVYSENMPGLFHAGLDGGMSDTLLLRSGTKLYRHAGWSRGWEEIESGLQDEARPVYPEQFVVINNKIVWTNGTDRARVITGDGAVHYLGFQTMPSAPMADGPTPPRHFLRTITANNSEGYSYMGRIGTSSMGTVAGQEIDVGGHTYAGIVDRMMRSRYYYYAQWEDVHGNLSALSDRSNSVAIYGERTFPSVGINIDDITMQLLCRIAGDAPEHAVAIRLYRTPDVNSVSSEPQFLVRIPGASGAIYPDNIPDAELGAVAKKYVPVPRFKVATAYQGRLVIANFEDMQGAIRVSEPGFPGSFEDHMIAIPDSGGAEVTGLASHEGNLFAFTRTSIYALEITPAGIMFTPVSQAVGCVAPGSIKGMTGGALVWLGADGFYGMVDGEILALSDVISKTVREELSRPHMRMAVACIDGDSGEYRCAVTRAGSNKHDMMLCFGEFGWRRIDLKKEIGAICTTDDERRYTLFTGTEFVRDRDVPIPENPKDPRVQPIDLRPDKVQTVAKSSVFVFDRERTGFADFASTVEEPITSTENLECVYRSAWFRADDVGLTPFNVRMMYIGLLDSAGGDDTDVTIRFYRDGRWSPVTEITDVLSSGVDAHPVAGEAVIGTDAIASDRRPFWRKVNPDLQNVTTWAFEISAKCSSRLHLQGFAFDVSTAGTGTPLGRVPTGDEK